MSNIVNIKPAGLNVFVNQLSEVPEGSLLEADNVVIDRDGIVESRRGFGLFGTLGSDSTLIMKQIMNYKDRILGHIASKIYFDNSGNGNFSQFAGVYDEVSPGLRIKYVESNGNYYFTTSTGIKKIGASSASDFSTDANFVVDSGGVPAITNEAWLDYSVSGFLPGGSAVGYKVVWGFKDLNNNNILGVPSNQTPVYSPKETLLINSFNNLLLALDNDAHGGLDPISDTNYFSTLQVSSTGSASELYNSLIDLSAKLDIDVASNKYSGVRDISSTALGATTTVTTSTAHKLAIGDLVDIAGSNSVPSIDGTWNVLTIGSPTTFTINFTTTANGTASGKVKYTGAARYGHDIAPLSPPIGSDLTNLEDFYNAIVGQLLIDAPNGTFDTAQTSSTVNLKVNIPSGVSTVHFYQIYRTSTFTQSDTTILSDIILDDEHRLIFEGNPTDAEMAQGYLFFVDNTPDSFRDSGTPLYTNPNTGEGISQTNNRPPLAQDIALFKNSVWFANTSTRHNKTLNLISVLDLVNNVSTLTITDNATSNTYTFVTGAKQVQTVGAVADVAGSLNNKYFTISSARNRTSYYVWLNVNNAGVDPVIANKTGIEVALLTGDGATVVAQKISNALDSYPDFAGTDNTGSNIVIQWAEQGPATAAADGNTTGFTFNSPSTAGTGEDAATKKVLISSNTSVAQAIDETAQSIVRVVNANSNEIVYAYYQSTSTSLPGIIRFERKDITNTPVYFLADNCDTSNEFSPPIQVAFTGDIAIGSPIIQNINSTDGFQTGQPIIGTGIPAKALVLSVDSGTQITLTLNATATAVGTNLRYGQQSKTDNEVSPNRLYYSKYGQPEAIPLVNYMDLGPKDKAIKRIIPLRESLLVFKEEAIYRVTGESALTGFIANLFDSSTNILAPDSACVLNNQVYMYSQQGVAVTSETGVSVISRPIENVLLKLRQFDDMEQIIFGISYEADRSYLLFCPTVNGDTIATQVYRYNTFTQTWTRWIMTKSCGVINPSEDKLYLGDDSNTIDKERKNFERQDYADREFFTSVLAGTVASDGEITLANTNNIQIGDILSQTQYLTVSQYNRLLQKLDMDILLNDTTFLSDLKVGPGEEMFDAVSALANKLDADTGTTAFTTAISPFTNVPSEIQGAFNAVVDALNVSTHVTYTDYQHSTGTVEYDANVLSVNLIPNSVVNIPNRVVVHLYMPFVAGPISIFKHIDCRVSTAPQTFGDPSQYRQVREGTFVFENNTFIGGIVGYSSDLFPNFEDISFGANGNGVWGEFDWGGFNSGTVWGGGGGGAYSSVPLRTYIPRDKQRCRFIKARFKHINAWNKWALYGITLVANEYSTRAYR